MVPAPSLGSCPVGTHCRKSVNWWRQPELWSRGRQVSWFANNTVEALPSLVPPVPSCLSGPRGSITLCHMRCFANACLQGLSNINDSETRLQCAERRKRVFFSQVPQTPPTPSCQAFCWALNQPTLRGSCLPHPGERRPFALGPTPASVSSVFIPPLLL